MATPDVISEPDRPDLVTIARLDSLELQVAFTGEPWRVPADALVLPANTDGRPDEEDELVQAFQKFLGPYWPRIGMSIDLSGETQSSFDIDHPSFVRLLPMAPLPSSPKSLILATIHSSTGRQPHRAARCVVALAALHDIKRLTLPLLGTGKGGPPRETAVEMLRAIQGETYHGVLDTVIVTTSSKEAYEWLLRPQSTAATISVAVTSAVPATALLDLETSSLGLKPTGALSELFAVAGRLGPQRREVNKQITTSLLLFAAVELGTRRILLPGDQMVQEWAYLDAFVGAVRDLAPDGYEKVRADYFARVPNPNVAGPTPTFESLTDNTVRLLRRAAEIDRGQGLRTVVLGADRFLMALINSKETNALQTLQKMGISVERLRSHLETWAREWSPSVSPANLVGSETQDSAKIQRDVKPDSAPPRAYISAFQNDDPRGVASDLINIENEVIAFARLVASCNVPPPLSIGVFGDWGSGKTYFMERMYDAVEGITTNSTENNKTFYNDIVQIRFNAWHYIETNLWASLVEYIFNELDRWLRAHEVARPRVEALFDQLATSRQLKLDAYRDLIATRREVKAAEEEVEKRRQDNALALRGAAASPVANPWPVVAQAFLEAVGNDKTKLKQAADALGLSAVRESADGLATLVEDTRVQAIRGRVIGNALIARLGSVRGAATAACALLVVPIFFGWLSADVHGWQWLRGLNSAVIGIVSSLSAAVSVAGIWLRRAQKGLDTLDALRSKLDAQVRKYSDQERQRVANAEVAADQARQSILEAEQRVVKARDRAIAAKHEYDAESARGRLNRFIQGKVADATYAKHLGIIASIRKDFGQLTAIMQSDELEVPLRREIDEAEKLHHKKVDALIADAAEKELLDADEISDLQERGNNSPPRSFQRIILYIDDLDRCPPKKVVEVLQAIHMLLYFPLFVVVVAVDARWVSRALKTHYPDLIADNQIGKSDRTEQVEPSTQDERPADARDYLEKIFQLPYWVREMDKETSIGFVDGLASLLVENKNVRLKRAVDEDESRTNDGSGDEREGVSPAEQGTTLALASAGNDADQERVLSPDGDRSETKVPLHSAVKPTVEFAQVTFSDTEKRVIAEFAPFVGGSPRRAKRYVNLYLLLKTSLGLGGTELSDRLIAQRALMALLAIVVGSGRPAKFFDTLEVLKELTLANLVEALGDDVPIGGQQDAREVIRKLIEINQRDGLDQDAEIIGTLRQFAPTVRRYSF